jgi:aminoglycoside phosphotransferase (APT) family kinase protein
VSLDPPPGGPAVERRGRRVPWREAPPAFRSALEDAFGSTVVAAVDHPGGFSPGTASTVTLADGRRLFAKVIRSVPNPTSVLLYRAEARVLTTLGPGVPAARLLWQAEGSDDPSPQADSPRWFGMVIEHVEGRHPRTPWEEPDLRRVLAALAALGGLDDAAAGGPFPAVQSHFQSMFTGWRRLAAAGAWPAWIGPWARARLDELADAEERWPDATAGASLVHGDLRSDNLLLAADRVVIVDWPNAARGAPWFDLVGMLPSMILEGGADPVRLLAEHPLTRAVPAPDVDALIVAMAGYFVRSADQPAPPGLPTLRGFQRAQGEASLRLLRARWGD